MPFSDNTNPSKYTTSERNTPMTTVPSQYHMEFSVWTPWTSCTASCNGGKQTRIKLCRTGSGCKMQMVTATGNIGTALLSYRMIH